MKASAFTSKKNLRPKVHAPVTFAAKADSNHRLILFDIDVRGTRYDVVNPDRWWTSRSDWRWVLNEGAKLLAYELGLGA